MITWINITCAIIAAITNMIWEVVVIPDTVTTQMFTDSLYLRAPTHRARTSSSGCVSRPMRVQLMRCEAKNVREVRHTKTCS